MDTTKWHMQVDSLLHAVLKSNNVTRAEIIRMRLRLGRPYAHDKVLNDVDMGGMIVVLGASSNI